SGTAWKADAAVAPIPRPARGAVAPNAGRPVELGSPAIRGGRRAGLRAELFDLGEEPADLRRPEAAVAAEGADGRDLARTRPARDGLGVHLEHHGNLARREELVVGHCCVLPDVWIASIRVIGPNRPVLEDQ